MLCLSIKRPILRSERGSKFRLHVINTFMELEATHFVNSVFSFLQDTFPSWFRS